MPKSYLLTGFEPAPLTFMGFFCGYVFGKKLASRRTDGMKMALAYAQKYCRANRKQLKQNSNNLAHQRTSTGNTG